jgi:hypothetical protein
MYTDFCAVSKRDSERDGVLLWVSESWRVKEKRTLPTGKKKIL